MGNSAAIRRAERHPLARALRIDKLSLAALEATLRLYRDPAAARREIPVLAMLESSERELGERARRLADGIGSGATVIRSIAKVGGGALRPGLVEIVGSVHAYPEIPQYRRELIHPVRRRSARAMKNNKRWMRAVGPRFELVDFNPGGAARIVCHHYTDARFTTAV